MALSVTGPSTKHTIVRPKANSDSDSEAPPKKRPKTNKTKIAGAKKNAEDAPIKRTVGAKKPLALTEQNRFIVERYDNSAPGLSRRQVMEGMRDEFNERFKDELNAPLAWKTLDRRYPEAKMLYDAELAADNAAAPMALAQGNEDEEEEEMNLSDDVQDEAEAGSLPHSKEPEFAPKSGRRPAVKPPRRKAPVGKPAPKASAQAPTVPDLPHKYATIDWVDQHPGASIPSVISATHIPPLSRINFHLRTRSDELAVFTFAPTINEVDIPIEHSVLHSASPFYADFSKRNPDAPIFVPKHFCPETVNAFVQLICPERATSLPTHYLWASKVPESGVFDRFGSMDVEKIHWSVETLLEFYVFARRMEVFWIGDMVIDRLHWMYLTQKMIKDACASINRHNGWISLGDGEKRIFGSQLPYVPDLEVFSMVVEDFDTVWLTRLGTAPADVKMLTFIADMMRALGGGPDKEWLSKAPMTVQNIFALSASSSQSPLVDSERAYFCSAYHHHEEDESCYTTVSKQKADNYFIHQLYAASSRDELLTLSEGVTPPTDLASMVYASSGTQQKLHSANSSTEMLDAEKMVLEMEMRLERAKMALAKAQAAGKEEKTEAIGKAKDVAEGMFSATSVMRK